MKSFFPCLTTMYSVSLVMLRFKMFCALLLLGFVHVVCLFDLLVSFVCSVFWFHLSFSSSLKACLTEI